MALPSTLIITDSQEPSLKKYKHLRHKEHAGLPSFANMVSICTTIKSMIWSNSMHFSKLFLSLLMYYDVSRLLHLRVDVKIVIWLANEQLQFQYEDRTCCVHREGRGTYTILWATGHFTKLPLSLCCSWSNRGCIAVKHSFWCVHTAFWGSLVWGQVKNECKGGAYTIKSALCDHCCTAWSLWKNMARIREHCYGK